jgi:non-ribosomal peptide synthetase component F
VPFEKLVEELQPKRDLDIPPLVQVALGLQNGPQVTANLAGLETSLLNPEHETVRYDLTVWVMEGARELHFLWTYNAELFEARTIRLMARRFGTLLRNIVDHSGERLSTLEMVAETERTEQLVEEKEVANRIVAKLGRTQRKAIQVPKISAEQVVVYEHRNQYKDTLQ